MSNNKQKEPSYEYEMDNLRVRGSRYNAHNHRPIFNVENPYYGISRPLHYDTIEYPPENNPNLFNIPAGSSSHEDFISTSDINMCDEQGKYLNYYHRTTSIHRNVFKDGNEMSSFRTVPSSLEFRRKWMFSGYTTQETSLQEHADDIASCMEQDDVLMHNSPESELLRRAALRDMPQCLTVKRIIKRKLCLTVNKHSRQKPISCFKNMQYKISMRFSKIKNSFKSLAYSFELWYSSLKTIEGHFGSSVASYFKYFRWMFIMNFLITSVVLVFVVFPQLLFDNFTSSNSEISWWNWEVKPITNNVTFKINDIFTGEGYFTDTILFYGHYTNEAINLISTHKYSMPYAYFFTTLCIYLVSFIVLSLSMAKSYRQSFIETQGGLKNNFAHKIFCGWDYSVATEEAANLKASSIYQELKELLSESLKTVKHTSCLQQFYTKVIQIICNIFIIMLLCGTGYVLWLLLRHQTSNLTEWSSSTVGVVIAVIINVIMLLFPTVFSFVIQYEDYKHPRAALYITLLRTFLLKVVVMGVFLGFWLKYSTKQKCWETAIGQHIYRLILFDFFFSVVLASLIEAVCYLIYKKIWRGIGAPTFDIARYTLQLMYNQTLFWVGFYFSPLLAMIVVLKLWVLWYVRRTCILKFCEPPSKSWRASQTQTLFLILSFLSLLLVIITLGYIMVDVETSKCGPFREYTHMYEMILKGIFQLEQHNIFWKILMYFTKPGVIALILVAMCVVVYYLRARAIAQKGIVSILRDMLVLEAKDKEFLLKTISKVTEGQWQYYLPRDHQTFNVYENVTDMKSLRRQYKPYDGDGSDETNGSADNFDQSLLGFKRARPDRFRKKHR